MVEGFEYMESCPSGRRCSTRNAVGRKASRVRIPNSPPRRSKLCIACSDFLCFAEKTERAHAAAPPLQPEADASVWAAERNHRAFLLKVDPDKSGFIGGMNVRNRPFLMFLLSFATLCFGYFVIRYILFDFHGMKQWPLVLLVGCVVVIVVSYLAHSKILPLVTSISYPLGFAVGAMFHTTTFDDAVGRTDNLWIIWTAVIMIAMIVSGIVEFIILKRKDS